METPEPPRRGLVRHEALARLSREHHHALAMARTLRRTLRPSPHRTGPGAREASTRYLEFYERELVPHFRAEEDVLFPRLVRLGYSVADLLAQHEQVRVLTERIVAAEASGGAEAVLLFELGELIERHVRLEERDAFEFAQTHIPGPELDEIGREIDRAEGAAGGACDLRDSG